MSRSRRRSKASRSASVYPFTSRGALPPRHGEQIQVGDNVIVVTLEHGLHDLRDILDKGAEG